MILGKTDRDQTSHHLKAIVKRETERRETERRERGNGVMASFSGSTARHCIFLSI